LIADPIDQQGLGREGVGRDDLKPPQFLKTSCLKARRGPRRRRSPGVEIGVPGGGRSKETGKTLWLAYRESPKKSPANGSNDRFPEQNLKYRNWRGGGTSLPKEGKHPRKGTRSFHPISCRSGCAAAPLRREKGKPGKSPGGKGASGARPDPILALKMAAPGGGETGELGKLPGCDRLRSKRNEAPLRELREEKRCMLKIVVNKPETDPLGKSRSGSRQGGRKEMQPRGGKKGKT